MANRYTLKARIARADDLASQVDLFLSGVGQREAMKYALKEYWRSIPPGPEQPFQSHPQPERVR